MINHLPDNIDKGLCIHRLCGDTGPCNDARMIFTVFSISRMSARLFSSRENSTRRIPGNGAGSGADSSPPAAETVSLPRSYNRHG